MQKRFFNIFNRINTNPLLFQTSIISKFSTKGKNETQYEPKIHIEVPAELKERIKSQMIERLKKYQITPSEAIEFREKVRSPTYGYMIPNLEKTTSQNELDRIIPDEAESFAWEKSALKYVNMMAHHRDQRYKNDPIISPVLDMDSVPVYTSNDVNTTKKTSWLPHKDENPNLKEGLDLKPQEKFELSYNYNFEQNFVFTTEYFKAMDLHSKGLIDQVKKIKPRKSKYDLNLENYDCWRVFDRTLEYYKLPFENAKRIKLSPYYLRKVQSNNLGFRSSR